MDAAERAGGGGGVIRLLLPLLLGLAMLSGRAHADTDALVAARRLLLALNEREIIAQQLDTYARQLPALARQTATNPDLAMKRFEQAKGYIPELRAKLQAHLSEVNEAVAEVYALHYSAADMAAEADFYQSDVGQRVASARVQVEEESRQALAKIIGSAMMEFAAGLNAKPTEQAR